MSLKKFILEECFHQGKFYYLFLLEKFSTVGAQPQMKSRRSACLDLTNILKILGLRRFAYHATFYLFYEYLSLTWTSIRKVFDSWSPASNESRITDCLDLTNMSEKILGLKRFAYHATFYLFYEYLIRGLTWTSSEW
jgi:hypothetical protein